MRIVSTSSIQNALRDAIAQIACVAEDSCRAALREAWRRETQPAARFALGVMNDNFDLAADQMRPVCQDTGMVVVFVRLGQDVRLTGKLLRQAVDDGVTDAYTSLRKSVLDPVSRINTQTNAPAILHIELVEGETVELEIMLKGFGSENMSAIYMLNPAQGIEEAQNLIVQTVRNAASNPCPPVIVGVGLGGTFEKAALMSKHALMRTIGSANPDPVLNEMERGLLQRINALGIGAQGFGGATSALGVFIESFPTHISSLPVAVNILCHCSRSKKITITGESADERG